jgi:hypothetical protein
MGLGPTGRATRSASRTTWFRPGAGFRSTIRPRPQSRAAASNTEPWHPMPGRCRPRRHDAGPPHERRVPSFLRHAGEGGRMSFAEIDIRSYDDLHHTLRSRVSALELPLAVLDDLVGAQNGYSAHVLSPTLGQPGRSGRRNTRRLGFDFAALFLRGLGLKMQIVEDEEARARYESRWTRRNTKKANCVPLGPSAAALAGSLRRDQCARAGRASMRQLSKPERSELGRRGAKARNEALTSRRRSEIARAAAISRWSRRLLPDESASIAA